MSAPAHSGTRFGRVVGASIVGTTVDPMRVSIYLAVYAVITLVAVLSYGETRTRDLAEDEAIVTKQGLSATRV